MRAEREWLLIKSGQAMFSYDSPRSTCGSCGDRIAKISKYDSPGNPWLHEHNYTARCPSGKDGVKSETFATPAMTPAFEQFMSEWCALLQDVSSERTFTYADLDDEELAGVLTEIEVECGRYR